MGDCRRVFGASKLDIENSTLDIHDADAGRPFLDRTIS